MTPLVHEMQDWEDKERCERETGQRTVRTGKPRDVQVSIAHMSEQCSCSDPPFHMVVLSPLQLDQRADASNSLVSEYTMSLLVKHSSGHACDNGAERSPRPKRYLPPSSYIN